MACSHNAQWNIGRVIHLAPFKMNDRTMNNVHCGLAIVSLLRAVWLWHLETAIKHIGSAHRRGGEDVQGTQSTEDTTCLKPPLQAPKTSS
jgi:hypothetical protein